MRILHNNPVLALEDLWTQLSEGFDTELERQETLLSLCIAQGEAARAHDLEFLEAKTEAISVLAAESAQAEQTRQELVAQLGEQYGLSDFEPTLSSLIAVAPERHALRLRELQTRMREVTTQTRDKVSENSRVIRRALRVVQTALSVITRGGDAPSGHYGRAGEEKNAPLRHAALLDRKG